MDQLYIHFELPETETTDTHGPFIGLKIDLADLADLYVATGGGAADEIITERDEWSPNRKQESKPDTICDEILITIPTEQKNSLRIYVFFETGHPGHPQQKTEVHGPFLEAVIADNALLVKTADEETSLELARYEEGADWWRRRHIGKDYP